jgi:hypothetical protein
MKSKDQQILENVYNEMAYRPLMPYKSVMPSVTKVKNKPASEEEYEERKVRAGLRIRENLDQLKANPTNLDIAHDIINIMNNFVVDEQGEREDFLVGDEELSYTDILELILDIVKTKENDPDLLLKKIDNEGNVVKGLTVDQYIKNHPERTNEYYYLFRKILDSLPDVKTQVRSRRETELGQEKVNVLIFYFSEKYDVMLDGEHIGYLSGKQFWPTERGKELKYEEIGAGKWKAFFTKMSRSISLENKRLEPLVTNTWDDGNPIMGNSFYGSNRRRPRRVNEPTLAPPPWPYNKYTPGELVGKTVEEIKIALKSDEAEKKFRQLYPEESFPDLYKAGKTEGLVSLPPV